MSIGQTKDGRWYVAGRPGYFPDDPTRRRKYFGRGLLAEKQARAFDAEIKGPKAAAKAPASGPSFGQLSNEYYHRRGLSHNSKNELKISLEKIILPAIGHRQAIRLTHADIDKFVATRRAHKTVKGTYVKDSTIRREITTIKAILNWSLRQVPPLIAFNPVANYKSPDPDDDVILPPSSSEAAMIYSKAAEHLKRAIVLSWYMGLRPGAVELLTLSWETSVQCPLLPAAWDSPEVRRNKYELIDTGDLAKLSMGVIRVKSAHKGGPQLRDVPIHTGLIKELRRWHEADKGTGALIHYHGRAIKSIQNSWEGALERAKIKRRIRPYDLRHHFATRALESGADIGALSDIMGSRPETLRRHYQHVSRELTKRTVEMIPELDITPDMTKAGSTNVSAAKLTQSSVKK